tara:strand:- start:577 stop:789 length:213 start_codon:yes stop_codon:yes gene_type:complete
MADLTKDEKIALVDEALRDHLNWENDGEDTRTLAELRIAFEARHLSGLVQSYRKNKANKGLESFNITDID